MKKKSETAGAEPRTDKEEKGKKKRKFGPVKTSICIVSAAAIAAAGTWACIAFLRPQQRNDVSEDYGSTVIEVKEGERFDPAAFVPLKERDENEVALSEDDGTYDAVDIYGRLNWTFGQQQNWYSEMHSEVQTAVGIQNVETYKRFSDGILISSDITTSSLVNDAREFCYVGDRVIWRESNESKDKWDGLNTSFSEGAPAGNMSISGENGFKKRNGLPATELSVYVIRSSTVESAELEVSDTAALADGGELYTVTYHLIPKTDETGSTGAAAYYGNQMVFSGGIDAPPTFNYITVSFTFTEDWFPVSCSVAESYTAAMKTIVSTCTSTSLTEYTYGVPELGGEVEEIYESYYKQYADSAATGVGERELTATDCLAGAFSPILSGPSCLDLDLDIDGKQVGGNVYLNLGGALEGDFSDLAVRAKLGDTLALYVEGGVAYVNYGNVKLSMGISDLVGLFATESAAAEEETETSSTDDLLARLVEGEFTHDETHARLHSLLPLGDIEADITFDFNVDENKDVTLGGIDAVLELGGAPLHIHAAFCENGPAPLTDAQKAEYADAATAASYLKEVISSGILRLDLAYTNAELGLALQGTLDLAIADGFALDGAFTLTSGGGTKEIGVAYDGASVYVNVDGIKVKATVAELVSFLVQLLPSGDTGGNLELSALLGSLFDAKFAENFTSAEAGDVLRLTLGGTQILRALGVEFDLGDLTLELSGNACTLSALGAKLSLQKGEAFTVDTEGYAEVVPYALNLYQLFSYGNVAIDLVYENQAANLDIDGQIVIDTTNAVAVAELNIGYGAVEKTLNVTYQGNTVYLALDGLKLKANVNEIAALLNSASPEGETDLSGILGAVLSLNFSKIVPELKNGKGTLELQLALDELLQGLGVDFSLGTANIVVSRSGLDITAEGLEIDIMRAEKAPAVAGDLNGYVELAPAVKTVAELLGEGLVKATLNYQGEFSLEGQIDLDINALKAKVDLTIKYQDAEKNIKGYFVNDGNIYLDVDGLKVSVAVDDLGSLLGMIPMATEETLSPVETLLSQIGELLQAEETENGLKLTVALDNILSAFGVTLHAGQTELVIDDKAITLSSFDGALSANITAGEAFTTETEGYAEVLPYVMGLYEMFLNENVSIELDYYNQTASLDIDGQIVIDTTNAVAVAELNIGYGAVEKTLNVTYQGNTVYLALDGLKLKANVNEIADLLTSASPEGDTELSGILGAVLSLNFSEIVPELKNGKGTLELQLALDELLQGLGVDFSLGTANIVVSRSGLDITAEGLEIDIMRAEKAPAVAGDLNGYVELAPAVKTVAELLGEGLVKATLNYQGEFSLEGQIDLDINALKAKVDLTIKYQDAEKNIKGYFVNDGNIYLDVDGLKVSVAVDDLGSLLGMIPMATEETLSPVETLLSQIGELLQAEETENGLKLTVALDNILSAFGVTLHAGQTELVIDDKAITLSSFDGALSANISAGENFTTETEGYAEVLPYVMGLYEMFLNENVSIALDYYNQAASLDIDGQIVIDTANAVAVAELNIGYGTVEKTLNVTYQGNTVYLALDGLKLKANVNEIADLLTSASPEGDTELSGILGAVLSLNFSEIVPELKNGKGTLELQLALDELLQGLGVDPAALSLGTAKVRVSGKDLSLDAGTLYLYVSAAKTAPIPAKNVESYPDIAPFAAVIGKIFAEGYLRAELSYRGELGVEGSIDVDLGALNVSATLRLTRGEESKTFRLAFLHAESLVYLEVDGLKIGATTDELGELIGAFLPGSDGAALAPVEALLGNLGAIVRTEKTESGAAKLSIALDGLLSAFGMDVGALGTLDISAEADYIALTAADAALNMTLASGESFNVETEEYVEVLPYVLGIKDLLSRGALRIALGFEGSVSLAGDIYLDLSAEEGNPMAVADLDLVYGSVEKEIALTYLGDTVYLSVGGLGLKANVNDLAALFSEGDGDLLSILGNLLSVNFSELIPALKSGETTLEMKLALDKLVAALGFPLDGFKLGEASVTASDNDVTLSMGGLHATIAAADGMPKRNIAEEDFTDIAPLAKTVASLLKDNSYLSAAVLYTSDSFTLAGEVKIDVSALAIEADLTATYGGAEKAFTVAYVGDGLLYFTVDGFRLSADIDAAKELISSLTKEGKGDLSPVEELLENLEDIVGFKSPDGTFEMAVALDEILRIFGIDFAAGNATITADGETLAASAMDGSLTLDVTRGRKFSVSTDGYIEIVSHVQTVLDLLGGDTVDAAVSLALGDLTVEGTLTVQMGTYEIFGDLTVTSPDLSIKLGLAFFPGENGLESGTLLVSINGFKIKGSLGEIVALVESVMDRTGTGMGDLSLPDLESLLPRLLSVDLREHLSLMETVGGGSRSLSVIVFGTHLIEALPELGLDFDKLTIKISEGMLALTMQGVDVKVTAGSAIPVVDAAAYADIGPIMETVSALLAGDCLTAEVNYQGSVTVTGPVSVSFRDPNAPELTAALQICAGESALPVGLYYGGGMLCLDLGGAKVKTSTEKFKELLSSLPSDTGDMASALDLLEHLGDFFTNIQSENGAFTADLAVNELLKALGVTADLSADVTLTVGGGNLVLSMFGDDLTVTVSAGEAFTAPDSDMYTDITAQVTSLIDLVQGAVEKKGVALDAHATLTFGGEQIDVWLEKAGITWENGVAFRGDIMLSARGSAHRISVSVTKQQVQLAYGNIGATIVFDDFGKIGDAFTAVKDAILSYINEILVKDPDKAAPEITSALALAEGGEALSGLVGAISAFVGNMTDEEGNFDISKLLGGLTIGISEEKDGILHLAYNGIALDLLCGESGLSLAFSLTLDVPETETSKAQQVELVGGTLTVSALKEMEAMPEVNYLGTEEFLNVIGYLGSAVDLLKTTDLSLTFKGAVTSAQDEYKAYGGVKYEIDAGMQTHRGKAEFFHLDVDGKNFWIDSDVYMHASVNITAKNTDVDSSLYIDMYILDSDPNSGEADNEPDFYVTLSQFGPVGSTVNGYNPVKLYAPASEIMTLLSSALPMFGIDVELLNDFMIFKWLTDRNTVEQFKAFGGIVSPLLKGLLGGEEKGSEAAPEGAETPEGTDEDEELTYFNLGDYLAELSIGAEGLNIVLNSKGLYGIDGLQNVTATLTKTADTVDADGNTVYGKFKTLDLLNIYDKEGILNTSLSGSIAYDPITPATLDGEYRSFLGAEKLLQALAKSATHVTGDIISGEETYHTYAVNSYFYIDGTIDAQLHLGDLDLITVQIKIIAVSVTVDEEGSIGFNLRLEYDGNYSSIAAVGGVLLGLDGHIINGNSTLDLTYKNGMIYMKRVQTNYYDNSSIWVWEHDWVKYPTPITLYRAMPIGNFTADIMNQAKFMFNFGDKLWAFIEKQVAGSEKPATPDVVDFGQRLDDVLTNYTYTPEAKDTDGKVTTPAAWDITLNGNALVQGVLNDILIHMSEGNDGYFHDITAELNVVSVVTATLSLQWHNPGGIMDEGVEDRTHDVSTEIGSIDRGMGGMIEELNDRRIPIDEKTTINGWQDDPNTADVREGTVYLEAKDFTVTYRCNNYGGGTTQLGTQTVMVSTGADGYAEYTLYSALDYPLLSEETAQFHYAWVKDYKSGDTLPSDGIVTAQQTLKTYTVTFYSDSDLGSGWVKVENQDQWTYTATMQYGAPVTIGDTTENVSDVKTEFYVTHEKVPSKTGRDGWWQKDPVITEAGATFIAEYEGDTIVYHSEVAFTADGVEGSVLSCQVTYGSHYTLVTPTAAGYTFLGWFESKDGGWGKVETLDLAEDGKVTTKVEALWQFNGTAGDAFSVELETVRTIDKTDKGWFTQYEYLWQYKSTLKIKGDCLIGAMTRDEGFTRTIGIDHYLANDNERDKLSVTNSPNISEAEEYTVYTWEQTWTRDNRLGTDYKRSHSYATVTFTYKIAGLDDIVVTVKVWDEYI